MKDELSSSAAYSEQVVQPTMRYIEREKMKDAIPTSFQLDCALQAEKHLTLAVTLLELAGVPEVAARIKPFVDQAKRLGRL